VLLAVIVGLIIGFSLGLTGAGGSILAVPLCIYVLGEPVSLAGATTLFIVGTIALFGVIQRLRKGSLDLLKGFLFSCGSALGAPLGVILARKVPSDLVMVLFSFVMAFVSWKMWKKAKGSLKKDEALKGLEKDTTKQVLFTSLAAIATGTFSGFFGVGGGFLIVPALVLFMKMPVHKATATSLLVIAVISASATSYNIFLGINVISEVSILVLVGGMIGMNAGTKLNKHLPSAVLQKSFSIFIAALSLFVFYQNFQHLLRNL
jgi:uncharacterized protein